MSQSLRLQVGDVVRVSKPNGVVNLDHISKSDLLIVIEVHAPSNYIYPDVLPVSVMRIEDGYLPRHSGTEIADGNHWNNRYFERDDFLTQVYASKRGCGLAEGQTDFGAQLPDLPEQAG